MTAPTQWTAQEAVAFVEKHGVVLESANGPAPSLAGAIAGEPIRGSWWSHPKGHEIFLLTRRVRASEEVLVCRMLGGKITFVHRRLWPALVRMADRFPREALSKVREIHTAAGQHRTERTPFPTWVPADVRADAEEMSEETALAELGRWISSVGPP